jgi:hypothetical protein
MSTESVCRVTRSWVEVGSFHTRLFGVLYVTFGEAAARLHWTSSARLRRWKLLVQGHHWWFSTLWFLTISKNGGDGGNGVYMREGTTSTVMVADRPYGEILKWFLQLHFRIFWIPPACKIHSYLLISCIYVLFKAKRYNSGLIIYLGHGENIYFRKFLISPNILFTPCNLRAQCDQSSNVCVTRHHVTQWYSV